MQEKRIFCISSIEKISCFVIFCNWKKKVKIHIANWCAQKLSISSTDNEFHALTIICYLVKRISIKHECSLNSSFRFNPFSCGSDTRINAWKFRQCTPFAPWNDANQLWSCLFQFDKWTARIPLARVIATFFQSSTNHCCRHFSWKFCICFFAYILINDWNMCGTHLIITLRWIVGGSFQEKIELKKK